MGDLSLDALMDNSEESQVSTATNKTAAANLSASNAPAPLVASVFARSGLGDM